MKFGDVVNYNGREWVYLAATPEIIYLAIIATEEDSQKLINLRNRVFAQASKNAAIRQQNVSWCFVELSTEEFQNRIAHYKTPEQECQFEDISTTVDKLNVEDQKMIKKEIAKDGAVSERLREAIKDIIIQES